MPVRQHCTCPSVAALVGILNNVHNHNRISCALPPYLGMWPLLSIIWLLFRTPLSLSIFLDI